MRHLIIGTMDAVGECNEIVHGMSIFGRRLQTVLRNFNM